ncbi:MAG: bifunctional oligoribonuclease/PAP phosphatase NrnA [Firmicutes bacterium]|nr:bifunctional oligoribonuclease/PAP phosphatase NrnA [Bacillota bacterium]
MTGSAHEVAEAISHARSFVVVCHEEPDPDCVGSMLAMDWGLLRLGKKSLPVSPDPMLPGLMFLPGVHRVVGPSEIGPEPEAALVLDCDVGRTGALEPILRRIPVVVNVDHHVTNPGTGDVNFVDSDASSTGEMVYGILGALGLDVEPEPAVCLYAALVTDTGSFRFSNTNSNTFQIASELVSSGANPHVIAREIYENRPWGYMRLLGRVLETLASTGSGKVAWAVVTNDMLRAARIGGGEVDGLVQYVRMIQGVEVALLFRELDDGQTRVSLRSRDAVDVSSLARTLGGGGHPKAAGCTVRLSLEDAKVAVISAAKGLLQDP